MNQAPIEVSEVIKVDPRIAKDLSVAAIKKDPIRALVELITNSDDSYRRLNSTFGIIEIELERKQKNSIFRVIDHAEGLDAKRMDEVVYVFGSDTSGITEGKDVRGFFGRGLKEAIIGLGDGRIISIKDGYQHECSITTKFETPPIYTRREPLRVTQRIRRKYGIKKNGTIVELIVTREGVRIPLFDNLAFQLSHYFSLRDINSSEKRSLILIDKKQKTRQKIEYKDPLGEVIINKEGIPIEDFPEAKFDIKIFKSKLPLTQNDYYRVGGLLIKGKNSIHEVSLMKYDLNRYAEKIFGNVKCKYLDELIKKGEPVISDRRDGLDWHHEFCRSLRGAIEKELLPVVEKIRKEEESKKKNLENYETKQRFISAIKRINEIALKELGIQDGKGRTGEGRGDRPPVSPPPNGFDFVPDFYKIEPGRRSTLSLKGSVPYLLSDGDIINVVSNNPDISIEQGIFTVKEEEAKDEIVVFNPKIVGKSVGSDAIITASCKDYQAEAYVEVVAKLERSKPKPYKGKEGLISNISYNPHLYERAKVRYYLERDTGIIEIATTHPCVKVYLGPDGEGQDETTAQVLVAELVIDAVCWEIAKDKGERGQLQIYSEAARTDVIKRERDRLINDYAHSIHQLLVGAKGRRL